MSETERIQIARHAEIDEAKLFVPIDDAIAYLQELKKQHPTASIDAEHFYDGYVVRLIWFEPETDEEFKTRCDHLEWLSARAEQRRKDAAERARIDAEIEKLKAQRPR